ncbi:MAG: DUF72 domain-containing protein [Pseudanabaenaceae cyanobacterium bins.39]|nr:DUF72 domain-containing protein [Pseudanabaenaceae cyanobacterium bins.39]
MDFRLGCAVWAYSGWVGDFYPRGIRQSEFLKVYSDRLTTVEINSTFYVIPDLATVKRWASSTDQNFRFCPKFPKQLSHSGSLMPHLDQSKQFLDLMANLDDRLGVTFVQLPPSYAPSNFADLEKFLVALRQDNLQIAVEVRHNDWFKPPHSDRLNALLTDLAIGRVLLDSRPIYTPEAPPVTQQRRKPNLPLQPAITAPFTLIRFISHPESDLNLRFWQEWENYLNQWLSAGIQVYFFMHCPIEERSPHHALALQKILEKSGMPIAALPWQNIAAAPQQLSLF